MANIIITDERSACLTDFGLTSVEDSQAVTLSSESGGRTTGTPRWQAPELLDSQFVDLEGTALQATCIPVRVFVTRHVWSNITDLVTRSDRCTDLSPVRFHFMRPQMTAASYLREDQPGRRVTHAR